MYTGSGGLERKFETLRAERKGGGEGRGKKIVFHTRSLYPGEIGP